MNKLTHHEASEAIKEAGLYSSADFYRVMLANHFAVAPLDNPIKILHDVKTHGSEFAISTLDWAIAEGHVIEEQHKGHILYNLASYFQEDVYFKSHLAMQIAYPELYWEHFGGTHVWSFDDPLMQDLLKMAITCISHQKIESDYYGEHEAPDESKTVGRPTVQKTEKKAVSGFKEWIVACQKYKSDLSDAYGTYLKQCRVVKEEKAKIEKWKKQAVKDAIEEIEAQCENGMSAAIDLRDRMLELHNELKTQGKPQRKDFE